MKLTRTLARGVQRGISFVDDGGSVVVTDGDGTAYAERLAAFGPGPTKAGVPITPESALRLIGVNAAVRLKVNAARSIPMAVYAEAADGFKDYAQGRTSRWYQLVHEQPNPQQPADELWAQVVGHLAYRANAYLWKQRRPGAGHTLLEHLWPIDPRRVKPRRLKGGRIEYDVYQVTGLNDPSPVTTLDQDDVIHIRSGLLDANGLVGQTAITQCREELATHAGVRDYLAHHIGSGANFAGFLSLEEDDVEVDDDERERIEEKLVGPGRGASGVTKAPLFNAKLKWTQIGMTLADQQFMELMGFGLADMALLMGVPPTLLNAPVRSSAMTYRNTAEEDQRFLKYGVSPELTAIESALRRDTDLFSGTPNVPEFRREAHLQMDTLTRYTAHATAIRAGWKTPNEVRRAENLPAAPGGDELLRPNQKPDPQTRELLDTLDGLPTLDREPALAGDR